MVVKDSKHKLVGFVDLGEMHDAFEKLSGTVIIQINKYYLILFIIVLCHWSGALTDCHNSSLYGIKLLIFITVTLEIYDIWLFDVQVKAGNKNLLLMFFNSYSWVIVDYSCRSFSHSLGRGSQNVRNWLPCVLVHPRWCWCKRTLERRGWSHGKKIYSPEPVHRGAFCIRDGFKGK